MIRGVLIMLCFVFATGAWCCEGDGDTMFDEAQAEPKWFDILIGQFDQHGKSYYEYQVEVLSQKEKLSKNERNELAVAYMHLGEFENSELLLKELIEEDSGYYKALSNRGLLELKQENYELAQGYFSRELGLNPEGFLGVEDWFSKKLEWELRPSDSNYGVVDFMDGWDRFNLISLDEYMKRLFILVKDDQTFAEGFYLLGKALESNENCHLAKIAFVRAEMVSEKYVEPEGNWNTDKYYRDYGDYDVGQIRNMIKKAQQWKSNYKRQEEMLLLQGIAPTFSNMKSKTEIHQSKNTLSVVKKMDGKLFVAIFVLTVIAYLLYSKHVRDKEETKKGNY